MKRTSGIFGLILITLLLLSLSNPSLAEEIHISTTQDLHQLASDASIDEWSRGKVVILQNDIDLNGESFTPIPIFGGRFDGEGHTISGLLIDEEGSNFGLFRYLESSGVIENLNVEGIIFPKGERNTIGALVGYNQGRIENSTFSGLIEGNEIVGGLVGHNGETGSIIESSVRGTIDGEKQVGGIAGLNEGTIIESRNRADINRNESISPGIDIGGIVGFNRGLIDEAENIGDVGYLSTGINIGGIAGRENGHISSSRNYGHINGENEVGGIVGKMEPHTNLIIPPSKLEELEDEIDLLDASITEMVRNTRSNSNSINPNLSQIQRGINSSRNQIRSLLSGSDDEDYENYERIIDALEGLLPVMDNMSDEVSDFMDHVSSQGNDLADDMEDANNQFSNVTELMMEIIEELRAGELEIVDIAVDLSRDQVNTDRLGTVTDIENYGRVQGDSNVGGIAGSITYDFILDLENEFGIEEEITINTILELRAIILDSENKGEVNSLYDNVGGIIGNMELGYISGAISTGLVESQYGDYVGGIAGNALGIIESSHAKNILNGRDYIGGIAGIANEILDSYSLIQIDKYNSFIGAIAGEVYEESIIERNYFVSDTLHGIDSVSYVGSAEPIEYEDLISDHNAAEVFEVFELSFIRDGRLVKLVNFDYGDSIARSDIPDIPTKDGYYGRWEDFDNRKLTFDREVHAEYVPYISILESEEERDGLPIVMVEGSFREDDFLNITSNENPQEDELPPIEQWQVNIPSNEDFNTIRYLPPGSNRNLEVYVLSDEHWIKTDSQWDGKYLVFDVEDSSTTFRLVHGEPVLAYLILAFIGVLIMALIINGIYNGRKNKKSVAK